MYPKPPKSFNSGEMRPARNRFKLRCHDRGGASNEAHVAPWLSRCLNSSLAHVLQLFFKGDIDCCFSFSLSSLYLIIEVSTKRSFFIVESLTSRTVMRTSLFRVLLVFGGSYLCSDELLLSSFLIRFFGSAEFLGSLSAIQIHEVAMTSSPETGSA